MTEKVLIEIIFEPRANKQDPEDMVEGLTRELKNAGVDKYEVFTMRLRPGWNGVEE